MSKHYPTCPLCGSPVVAAVMESGSIRLGPETVYFASALSIHCSSGACNYDMPITSLTSPPPAPQGEQTDLSLHKLRDLPEYAEVKSLMQGEQTEGHWLGVEWSAWLFWEEDWTVNARNARFEPHGATNRFWMSCLTPRTREDIFFAVMKGIPEVRAFQERIDACKEMPEDLLSRIIEAIELGY